MEKRQFEIIRDKFVDGLTWDEIGKKHGNTRQWAHQQYQNILSQVIYSDFYLKWMEKNKISQYAETELLDIILLVGPQNKEKIINLINTFNIKHPMDILKLSQSDILSLRSAGKVFLLNLKLAMLKYGTPYDDEDAESLLFQLERERVKAGEMGLQLRFKVLHRDGFRCHYCGRSPHKNKDVVLQIDHIMPVSKGGSWEEKNLITSCCECNLGKSNHTY